MSNDTNQHTGTGRLGTEPKFFNEHSKKPFAKLFVLINNSYEKDGVKHDAPTPIGLLVPGKANVEKLHEAHTGSAISWTGKLVHSTFENRSSYEIVVAGPGAKLELVAAKAKAAEAIGTRADRAQQHEPA